MSLNLKMAPRTGGGDRVAQPILEIGTYPARLVRIIDLGVQPQKAFKGEAKPPAHQVDWTYELLDVFMVDKEGNEIEDKPRWVSERFNVNRPEADLAKSTKRYKALDPDEDFDWEMTKLIGMPCMITITHGENKKDPTRPYENVGNVTAMRAKDAAKAPELKNPSVVFTLDEPDMEVFKKFPQWLQDLIKGNLEFKGSALEAALGDSKGKPAAKPQDEPEEALIEVEEDEEAW